MSEALTKHEEWEYAEAAEKRERFNAKAAKSSKGRPNWEVEEDQRDTEEKKGA